MDLPNTVIEIDSVLKFNELTENYKDKPILIDFWAEWCGPCKIFHPIYTDAQKKWGNSFVFARLNTELLPSVSQQLGISGIPTLIAVKDKREILRQSGAMRRGDFERFLQNLDRNFRNEGRNTSSMYS